VAGGLSAHAIAHLAGFAWPWWVREPLPSPPHDTAWVGDTVMRTMSVVWLLVAIGFLVAAFVAVHAFGSWRWVTAGAAMASLVLSVVCWPASLLGVPINLTILAMLWWSSVAHSRSRPAGSA